MRSCGSAAHAMLAAMDRLLPPLMHALRALLLAVGIALALPAHAHAQVDINHADAKALAAALNGVGLVKAEAIVAWREQHGPFRSLDDLAKVRGIGPRTIEANRAVVVIGPIMPPRDKSG